MKNRFVDVTRLGVNWLLVAFMISPVVTQFARARRLASTTKLQKVAAIWGAGTVICIHPA
jgi:hypothetical protein